MILVILSNLWRLHSFLVICVIQVTCCYGSVFVVVCCVPFVYIF